MLTRLLNPKSTKFVTTALSPLVNVQKRTKFTMVNALPEGEFEHVGDHGTTASRVEAMAATGVNPALTGKNFGKGSQGGQGLYLTTEPKFAEFFASNASQTNNELAQLVKVYRKKGTVPNSADLPSQTHYRPAEYTAFHEQNPGVHELKLGKTKIYPQIKGNGETVLLTENAIKDPNIDYYGVPQTPLPREQSAQIMESLDEKAQRELAHMRKTGSNVGRK